MFGTSNKLLTLKKKSADAIAVFTNTVDSLTDLNTEINNELDNRVKEIKRLEEEKAQLNATRSQNTRLITKINDFLVGDIDVTAEEL